MVTLEGYSIGRIVTPVGWDGSVFRPLLVDNLGRPLLVAGHDGVNYHVLKTDANGQLEVKVSGTVPDADTVDTLHASAFVLRSGDTMTGDLVLPADPTLDLQAATKHYVDTHGGGAGTLLKYVWSPDAPPATANAKDDEFNDNSWDSGKWTEFDPAAKLTISEANQGAIFDNITGAGENVAGAMQSVADADWTIWTKVDLVCLKANYFNAGLMCLQDAVANPTTSDILGLVLQASASDLRVLVVRWNAYNSWNSTLWTGAAQGAVTSLYLRMRHISSLLYYDFSTDGISWVRAYYGARPWAPKQVGIMANNVNQGVTCRAIFPFFRFLDAGQNDRTIPEGRLIKLFGV